MKRFAIACLGVLGLMFAGSAVADAGDVHVQVGRYGRSWYGGNNYYRGYGGYGYRNPTIWHDTSHYDYHSGGYVPHGNHYHYIPGHYDWHQTGHYDTFHRGHIHHGH